MQPDGILPVANELGECVLWDSRRDVLWWTDIAGKRLYRRHDDDTIDVMALPDRAASFALVQGCEQLLVAFAGGLALFDPASGRRDALWNTPQLPEGVRFNDGRVDRAGRFWCGSMVEDDSGAAKAGLYHVERGTVRPMREQVHIANGLAFSLDGGTLYFADSARRTIWRHPLDGAGTPGPGTVFAQTPAHIFPDGATVDADGCLWVAHWGGARVVRYTPGGRIDRIVPVPATQPSCVCFGGARRDLLFVTSARVGLSPDVLAREPHAGNVFIYRVGVSGVDEPEYRR